MVKATWVVAALTTGLLLALRSGRAAPATGPSSRAAGPFPSAAAVFGAIPAEVRPPEPRDNATDLQTTVLSRQVDQATQWLAANAVGRPVHIAGKVDSVFRPTDAGIDVGVEIQRQDGGPGYVTCTFPAADEGRLVRLNKGDAVGIDGHVVRARYDLNGEVWSEGGGQKTTTKILSEHLDVGGCTLAGK